MSKQADHGTKTFGDGFAHQGMLSGTPQQRQAELRRLKMTPTEFSRALERENMRPSTRTARAAKLALVDPGIPIREAARRIGIDPSAVIHAVHRLQPAEPCPHCGGTGKIVVPE